MSPFKNLIILPSLHQYQPHSKVAGNQHNLKEFSAITIPREIMANRKMATCLVLVLVAMLCAGATAQSGCTSVLISMSPCLNYITGNSSTPSQQCCTQLANVVRSSPQCLCEVLNGGGSSLGITINQTKALALPGLCNVQTPPTSRCNAASPAPADIPVGSPESGSIIPTAASPAPAYIPVGSPESGSIIPTAASPTPTDFPVGSPESGSIIPTGAGPKTAPSPQEDGSSEGSTTKLSLSLLILLLLATSYSSIFSSH